MSMNPQEDQFLEEVLGLFVLEAQEWVRQICAALLDLNRGPVPERAPKLFDTILRGITNLGGSAATVQLPAIEKLAFALVPLVHAIQRQGDPRSAEQFEAFHEALRAISSAVHNLAETRSIMIMDAHPILQRIAALTGPPSGRPADQPRMPFAAADLLPESPPSSTVVEVPTTHERAAPSPVSEPVRSLSVLEVLASLRQTRVRSLVPTRNLIDMVVRKAQTGSDPGGAGVEAAAVLTILREIEALDNQFLADVQERMPRILRALSGLKSGNSENGERDWSPEFVLDDVQQLLEKGRAVEASTVAAFFQGLYVFLSIAAQGRVKLSPQRFDAVESRLGGVLSIVQEWVEFGRAEQSAIKQALLVS